jgi:opacity protein-like surface antigen
VEITGGYRFSRFSKFSPYIRLGLGVSRRSYEHDFIKTVYSDTKTGVAAYAGLQYAVTERIGLSIAARYYVTGKTGLDNNWRYLFDAGRRQLGLLGGLTGAL